MAFATRYWASAGTPLARRRPVRRFGVILVLLVNTSAVCQNVALPGRRVNKFCEDTEMLG